MGNFDQWRGHDIQSRREKITRAMAHQELSSEEDFPIVINCPCYYGFGDAARGREYWEDPACMVRFQEEGYARHLDEVNDDTVPYFMPWFGTGVLASAFGCGYREAKGDGDDPAVTGSCIHTVEDIAHLKRPDPYSDPWMSRVLRTIDYAVEHSELPVGLTDMNSPLCTIAQMCGYDNLFIWMYDEPEAVHELFDIVTDAFIDWVKVQKQHNGEPLDASNGLQGVWSPKGIGVWMSDDDIVSMSPELYSEFVVPRYSRILKTFGGGSVHFCGSAAHQAENLLSIEKISVVNNSTLGRLDRFEQLARKLHGKVAIQVQDVAYADVEGYIEGLFNALPSLRGVMIGTFIHDYVAMAPGGGNIPIGRSAFDTARLVVETVRRQVRERI